MKYYLIAGETSGDLHASNLIKSLKGIDPTAQIRGLAGEMAEAQGCELLMHYREISFMGIVEVLANLKTITKAINLCKKDIEEWKPDAIIFIDFAGFNLRLAKYTKNLGIKNIYYVSPKIWAWQEKRGHTIKRLIDKMFVILPFEEAFYKAKFNYPVKYVGNPVSDAVRSFEPNPNFKKENGLSDLPILAVLPGSRKQEIEGMLHFMLSVIPPYLKDFQFVVAAVPSLPSKYYEGFKRHENIKVVYGQTYDLLSCAHGAMVTSGTATLETALFNVPQLVCYKMHPLTYVIVKALVNIKYISLPNLIADKPIIKELIQGDFNPSNLMVELDKVLLNENYRAGQKAGYAEVKTILGDHFASETTAQEIVAYLNE